MPGFWYRYMPGHFSNLYKQTVTGFMSSPKIYISKKFGSQLNLSDTVGGQRIPSMFYFPGSYYLVYSG